MPKERWNRWLAALVLALSCGVTAGLLAGDRRQGACVTLLLAGLVTVLVFTGASDRKSAREFYVIAAAVLVGPWILLALGYEGRRSSGPSGWAQLQSRFTARGAPPSDLRRVSEVIVNVHTSEITRRPYRFGGVAVALTDAGVYLRPSFPMSWVYEPVVIPLAAIEECQRSMGALHTTLALRPATLSLDVADEDDRVLEWCGSHGLAESDTQAVGGSGGSSP